MNKHFHKIAVDAASTIDLFNNYEPPHLHIEKFADELLTNVLPPDCSDELINAMMKALLECSSSDLEELSPNMFNNYKDDVLRIYEALIYKYYVKDQND